MDEDLRLVCREHQSMVHDGDVKDTDFAGLSWDIMKKGDRFAYIQSFMAFNLFNYPNFQDPFIDYGAQQAVSMDPNVRGGYGARTNLGNVWHTSAVYQDKIVGLNYFLAGGWSQTQPDRSGMFNDPFSPTGPNTDNENGYSAYLGVRYDLDNAGLKFGAEFNYGSQYWLAMSPGHDDIYQSKLATRGQVYEIIHNLGSADRRDPLQICQDLYALGIPAL